MLFTTTEELKAALGSVHKNLNFNTLLSFVRQAEQQYLVPALGAELVRALGEPLSAGPLLALREHVRAALAYYVVLEAAPMLAVAMGELGVAEQSAQNAAPVRQWVMADFKEAAADSADTLLELALVYLDEHAEDYADYLDAREVKARRGLIVGSAAELGRHLATAGSRRFFLALLPALRQVEELDIRPLLGQAAMDELTEALASAAPPAPAGQKLLDLLRPLVAHRALSLGLLHLNVALTGGTLRLMSDNKAVRQRQATPPEVISALSNQAQALADRYQARLCAYLDTLRPTAPPVSAELIDNSNSKCFRV